MRFSSNYKTITVFLLFLSGALFIFHLSNNLYFDELIEQNIFTK